MLLARERERKEKGGGIVIAISERKRRRNGSREWSFAKKVSSPFLLFHNLSLKSSGAAGHDWFGFPNSTEKLGRKERRGY